LLGSLDTVPSSSHAVQSQRRARLPIKSVFDFACGHFCHFVDWVCTGLVLLNSPISSLQLLLALLLTSRNECVTAYSTFFFCFLTHRFLLEHQFGTCGYPGCRRSGPCAVVWIRGGCAGGGCCCAVWMSSIAHVGYPHSCAYLSVFLLFCPACFLVQALNLKSDGVFRKSNRSLALCYTIRLS
jgi:hypothetical protein